MPKKDMIVFSGTNNYSIGSKICDHMGIPMGKSETGIFPEGEIIVRLKQDVRGRDCYVVISTGFPVNDNLMELLIFCDCLKRASARQIVVVIPYFGYGRQDRKDSGRVPITAKLVANLLEKSGAHRVLTIDLHAAQIQGFFDITVDHLSGATVFLDYLEKNRESFGDLIMVSPDVGNVKVAEGLAALLDTDIAIIHKRRDSGTQVTPKKLVGDVRGKTVLMFDDMISTAVTMRKAAEFVMEHGAVGVICAATHGLLVGNAESNLATDAIQKIIVSDTLEYVPPVTIKNSEHDADVSAFRKKFEQLSVAPLLGDAITRIHNNLSVSELFERTIGLKR